MLYPLNKASLGYCAPDQCVPTLDRVKHGTSSVRCSVWPASHTSLTRLIGLAPLSRMHARPTQRTPPFRSIKARDSWKSGVASLNQIWIWGRDGSVRTLFPRYATSKNFLRGHIGRDRTNIAPTFLVSDENDTATLVEDSAICHNQKPEIPHQASQSNNLCSKIEK